MKLYINDAPMGECKSYEQVREARRPGWLFHMETGLNLFIRFDEIHAAKQRMSARTTAATA